MKQSYDVSAFADLIPREDPGDCVDAIYLRPGQLLMAIDRAPVAYLPLGTVEWHGRHNPLGCDALKTDALCRAVARKVGGVVFPPLHFGTDSYIEAGSGIGMGMDAYAGFALPGSYYRIDEELFVQLLIAACGNYLARGFKLVYLVSGHNAQIQGHCLGRVAHHFANEDGYTPVAGCFEFDFMPDGPLRQATGDHAGGYETAMMLHLHGERVNLDASRGVPRENLAQSNAFPMSETSAEQGRARFEAQVQGFCDHVTARLAGVSCKR